MHTTIKNTSGETRTFSFIPPHGRELDDNEEVDVLGEIIPQITTKRARQAYEDAIQTGEITLVTTPAVIIKDDSSGDSKQVVLDTTLDVDDQRISSL